MIQFILTVRIELKTVMYGNERGHNSGYFPFDTLVFNSRGFTWIFDYQFRLVDLDIDLS